jgi:hypothetical protein
MSDDLKSSVKEGSRHLIDLIIHQDQFAVRWVQFLVTVEAGLAVGLAFVVRPGEKPLPVWYTQWAQFVIPVFGILVAWGLTAIVIRERKWTSYYVQRYRDLRGLPDIFDKEEGASGSVKDQKIGFVGKAIVVFAIIVTIAWFTTFWRLAQ